LRLLRFYQANCTLVVHYYYVTGGVSITFQISRSTGVSVATAFDNRQCLFCRQDGSSKRLGRNKV